MEKDNATYRFLLGGYDLEMITIREILDEYGCRYEDRNLKWGAKLSAYADLFNEEDHFVGIELIEDVALPPNYTCIDHHNNKSHLPSSIEQVAELLGHEFTHYQQLVVANDKGYIPALEAAGATSEEILKIRKADRDAQGVTEEDDRLAKLSIEKHKYKIGNVTVIESLTPMFSAIMDSLYPFNNLLIKHNTGLTYYGEKAIKFAEKYKHLIESGKAYFGGQGNNFFGIDSKSFSVEESELLFNEIINQI